MHFTIRLPGRYRFSISLWRWKERVYTPEEQAWIDAWVEVGNLVKSGQKEEALTTARHLCRTRKSDYPILPIMPYLKAVAPQYE